VADLRYRLNQGWPKVLTALPPKRELIFTPLNATYKVLKSDIIFYAYGTTEVVP
jgi:hypothetical protein